MLGVMVSLSIWFVFCSQQILILIFLILSINRSVFTAGIELSEGMSICGFQIHSVLGSQQLA